MKFISKNANLLIVLRAGLSAQPMIGQAAKPTVSVRFKDCVADVPDGELLDMMMVHPGYKVDYFSAESVDEKSFTRNIETEPAHIMTTLKYGTPVDVSVKGGKVKLPKEIEKLLELAEARGFAKAQKEMPSLVEKTIKTMLEAHDKEKKASVPKKGKEGKKEVAPDPAETPEN